MKNTKIKKCNECRKLKDRIKKYIYLKEQVDEFMVNFDGVDFDANEELQNYLYAQHSYIKNLINDLDQSEKSLKCNTQEQ